MAQNLMDRLCTPAPDWYYQSVNMQFLTQAISWQQGDQQDQGVQYSHDRPDNCPFRLKSNFRAPMVLSP